MLDAFTLLRFLETSYAIFGRTRCADSIAGLQKTHNVLRAKRNALNLENKKAEMQPTISAALAIRMVTSSGLPLRAATLPALEERERLKMRKLKLSVLLLPLCCSVHHCETA